MIVAIDGPAGSGKSTIARLVAEIESITYLDTGAMYRAVGLACLRNGVDWDDEDSVRETAESIHLDYKIARDGEPHLNLNGEDVTHQIRTSAVDDAASRVSTFPFVRRKMVEYQRRIAAKRDVVAEGRDMTSVVFPNADVKIYLDADLDTRAERRFNQRTVRSLERIKEELRERDERDMNRSDSPLQLMPDVIFLNTAELTVDEVLDAVRVAMSSARFNGRVRNFAELQRRDKEFEPRASIDELSERIKECDSEGVNALYR